MKNLFALIALSFFSITASGVESNSLSPLKKTDSITVTGTGVLDVAPDMATLHMSVVTKSTLSRDAQNQNAVETKKLVDALMEVYKLPKTQIVTTSFTISPEYTNEEPRKLIGYAARHSLAVRVNFIEGVGEVLDLAINSGATSIEYIQFGLQNQKEYELQSLKLAMNDSLAKATAIADSAGRKISRVIKVSEGEYSIESQRDSAEDREEGTEVYPSNVSITATLTVMYEI